MRKVHHKDAILDELAARHNVAQFISYGVDQGQRYSRVLGYPPNHVFPSISEAIGVLLGSSSDHMVNVRSFLPNQPRSHEFIQKLRSVTDVVAHITRLSAQGLTVIVNETIDVSDGGVSGVATPQTLEFAPDSTPRAVEDNGVARLPRYLGDRMLEVVYGFKPDTPTDENLRLEFSIHPRPRGWMNTHTILWEREALTIPIIPVRPTWPNKFSSFLGDKVYGLLVAWLIGLPVPHTIVTGRRFASFAFGELTGGYETWVRTAPAERTPGHFTTKRGWTDPFALMYAEDPDGRHIASILSQRGIRAFYSGAAITESDGSLRVEGTSGSGDEFMLTGSKSQIPRSIETAVRDLNEIASRTLGPISFEWVHDGNRVWIVQLHVGQSDSLGDVIYPGEPERWIEVEASSSLDQLRAEVSKIDPQKTGIVLIGNIGTSSHKGDLLRKARVPSRLRYSAL